MTRGRPIALAHAGAEGDPNEADGPQRAAEAAVAAMRSGKSALDAVVEAVRLLEDDERFNAGHGSNLRLDARTVQMDAALLDSTGRVAAVMGLSDVRNPILVARDLLGTTHPVLAAPGATRFARLMGHARFDPRTQSSRGRLDTFLRAGGPTAPGAAPWRAFWNYEEPPIAAVQVDAHAAPPQEADTVGALAWDGRTFAAAGSTGGLMAVLDGRVSDIAVPGCGLDASEHGAVCVSGAGDHIVRARVAARTLRLLEDGLAPEQAAERALAWIPQGLGLAVLALDAHGVAGARGRRPFPWGVATGEPDEGAR